MKAIALNSMMGGMGFTIVYMLVIIAVMYFLLIRPQRNEQKRVNAMLADLAVGDSVVTTGGFYGVVLDITDEDVIVEFGHNKNCRIPLRNTANEEDEKADSGSRAPADTTK